MSMSIQRRLDLQQQRESGLLALIHSAQDLSKHLDLKSLLRAIVSRARALLGSEVAWLSTYDHDLGKMHVLAADGAISQSTNQMIAGKNFGVASVVWETHLPFTTQDYLSDKRFPHEPTLDKTFREEGITALAGVPLIWEDEVIGLLFVADRYHRTHTALSISILSTLATHATVAIKNAKSFEQASNALKGAECARLELDRYSRAVQIASDAHAQMTSLLARGASLSSICESISNILGAAVLVLDEAAQLVSCANPPNQTSKRVLEYKAYSEVSNSLAQSIHLSRQLGHSIVVFKEDSEICRVIAIIGGEDVLGSIVIYRPEDLDEVGVRTFERCASVVGISLLAQERTESAKSRHVSLLVNSLISMRQDSRTTLISEADRLGLDLSNPITLILIEQDNQSAAYIARRLRNDVDLFTLIFDEVDGILVFICSATAATEYCRSIDSCIRRQVGTAYRGVISRPASSAEIPALFSALRRAINVLGRLGVQAHIISQNEMAMYSTLFETQDQASLQDYLNATIGSLMAHDQKRGSELTRTLLMYFDNNQNANQTAKRLGIHVNTVHQRLDGVEKLIGYLGNASRALEIHVALRLWSLITPAFVDRVPH